MKACVVINAASGSCNESDEAELTRIISEAGIEIISSWCGNGEGLVEALKTVVAAKPELLVVLGGDGTIRSVVEVCKDAVEHLIPLPGGTMNLLTKAVYGDRKWNEILVDTLASPTSRDIPSGKVAGKTFYVAAVLGTPSLLAHTREAVRAGDIGAAVTRSTSMLATPFITFSYESLNEAGTAETLLVTTPLVSDALHNEARALDVAAISIPGALETLRLMSAAALGIWRQDENVMTHAARKIHVSATDPIPATLDGEPVELPKSVDIEFVPAAFRVLIPRQPGATG